jgi:hypothetical protein
MVTLQAILKDRLQNLIRGTLNSYFQTSMVSQNSGIQGASAKSGISIPLAFHAKASLCLSDHRTS